MPCIRYASLRREESKSGVRPNNFWHLDFSGCSQQLKLKNHPSMPLQRLIIYCLLFTGSVNLLLEQRPRMSCQLFRKVCSDSKLRMYPLLHTIKLITTTATESATDVALATNLTAESRFGDHPGRALIKPDSEKGWHHRKYGAAG